MKRTCVIGITGSVGKTSSTELLQGLLSARHPSIKSAPGSNYSIGVPLTLLRIRPWHRFAVLEAGTFNRGDLRWITGVMRPDIAAILCVKLEHYSAFRRIEAVAEEKQSFLDGVRPDGTVWLNWDDPLVAGMTVPAGLRVHRFGTTSECDLWASNIDGAWPDRLSFDAHHDGKSQRIQTRFVGSHWLPSVLAAIGIALDCGISLDAISVAIMRVEPMLARLQPVTISTGATMLRDDSKGSLAATGPALQVLSEARGVRKWLVSGGTDDNPRSRREVMKQIGRLAAGVADAAVFVGEHAETAVGRARDAGIPTSLAFHAATMEEAARILREKTREGDLILLKGPRKSHLARVYHALAQPPRRCTKPNCRLAILCDFCPDLRP